MFLILQIALLTAMLAYLGQRQAYLRRRNRQTWNSLWAQAQRFPSDSANPWTRLRSARVAMEMADYAERNSGSNSQALERKELESLRRDAMAMRLASLRAIVGFATPEAAK